MSYRAWAYFWSTWLFGLSLAFSALLSFHPDAVDWTPFLILTLFSALAHLFKAETPRHQLYPVTLVFLFAGIFLLDPFLFVLLALISQLIGWIKERLANTPHLQDKYLQSLDPAIHLIAGAIARYFFLLINGNPVIFDSEITVLAIALAISVFLAIDHLGAGVAISLARRISFRDSGALALDNLLMDTVLLVLGATIGVLWTIHPFLLLLALPPLVLSYQVLKIPQLKKEAFTDEKTGLWNSRHFGKLLIAETERAKRFNRPLAFIMADLDLLRNINNTYGHLAGDAVLSGIGQIIRNNLRNYDIAARFGGEEFSIALPETSLAQARGIAERIREAVQSTRFETSTCPAPIRATMSFGVACFTQDAVTPTGLIHKADIAVYQAKLRGRNCVVCSSEIPASMRLDSQPVEDRIEHPFVPYFSPRPELAGEASHNLNSGLFHTVANLIDTRRPYLSSHSNNVADYATALAKEMGLPPQRVARVRQAALLHDIGNLGISDRVLGKLGKLTESEYEYVKTHAALGAHFVETCPGLRSLAPAIRHHHEWWNGSGYPARLQKDQIPLEARILAICDAVEAMASHRPYRQALWLNEIIAELKKCAGTQFDPQIADVFVRILEREGQLLVDDSAQMLKVESAGIGAVASSPC